MSNKFELSDGSVQNENFRILDEEADILAMEEAHAKQADASEALNNIETNLFQTVSHGKKIYPDEYAGMYINGSKAKIMLTSLEEQLLEKYRNAAGNKINLEFEQAAHSLNDLNIMRDAVINVHGKNMPLTQLRIDYAHNCIDVFIDFENQDEIKKEFEETLKSREFVENYQTENHIGNGTFNIKKGYKMSRDASAIGGMKITSTSGFRSIGIWGTIEDGNKRYNGIITAAHNVPSGDVFSLNSSTFGT